MDTGNGYFEMLANKKEELERLQEKYPNHGGVFREGETLEIKGSLFEVSKIIRNGLKLRLLSK